jgi:hypothetical protein
MNGIELFNKMKEEEDDKVRVCFFPASELLNSNCKTFFKDSDNGDKFLFVSKQDSSDIA